ncbi:glycerate kinase [Stappia sp. F7233]|uniref:Glycerate kinase n=1 Tax=Stappia albiluteola TaxID=2758565 RepID=A0A839AFK4_9HYPH|nr:glycerate kinase [Stappia albiluteola]MBA5777567.1 glycerate kinase [Stappia albiluteola]
MSFEGNPTEFLKGLFARAVEVADPMLCVPAALPRRPEGRVLVIGAGKASARMAEAVESVWGPQEGLVITRDGYARPCRGIEIIEASHPVPDERGLAATARMLDLVSGLGEGDFVLALISGGASALLVQPAGDITLAEKKAINSALLSSGAPIDEMNKVRKHLSRVKGGQLAAASHPADMLALMISDVPGDDPAFIGSGPTVGDSTSVAEAVGILDRLKIDLPSSVRDVLASGGGGVLPPGAEKLSRVENRVIAAPSQSLEAAAELARSASVEPRILGDAIEGEAREVAREQAAFALRIRDSLKRGDRPVLLLSGGECTVTRRGDGIGGPNAEFALALALALDGEVGISAIACDTDGVDGAADVAGAVIDPTTLARARHLGLDPADYLARNDSHSFFAALGDQVVPGPTLTNVNDFRAILIQPAEE